MTPQNPQRTKRFAIGLSFPEAYRKKVQAIADCLTEVFPKESILYDGYHEAELARPSKDTYLQDLFKNQTGLVVVFLCHAYHEEVWCGLEWRAIRARMNAKDTSSIMLLQLDEGTPDGFFGNVDGYVDISRKSDSEVADLIRQRYNFNHGTLSSEPVETDPYTGLKEYLATVLERTRKAHPSFQLMEIDEKLFPDGLPELHRIEALDDGNKPRPVKDIVQESWSREKNHLMIEGEGGIGKTVTLFFLPDKFATHQVPAIYIQLHELKKTETIEQYIGRTIFPIRKDLFWCFLQLTEEAWKDGPRILLLLDGFNEIEPDRRFDIGEDIKWWADRPGVQIITSSRFDIHTFVPLGGGYGRIVLQPLSRDTIEEYLSRAGIPLPQTDSQWSILDFPLMLALYAQTEKVLSNIDKDERQDFRESDSAGAIIWNYLQREIWRFRKDPERIVKCVLATEFVAPYIAWQMQKEGLFYVDKTEFRKLIKEACEKVAGMESGQFPPHIADLLYDIDCHLPGQTEMTGFLEKDLRLFARRIVKRRVSYSLMHQQFRDALAAMHLINVTISCSYLPTEWLFPLDFHVLNFVSDLTTKEDADQLWELNRISPSTNHIATLNLLELQKRKREYDFSELNFSGLDLREISLYPLRVPESHTLRLPRNESLTDKLQFSRKTLYSDAHYGYIQVVAISSDGKRCISGSWDHSLRVWDLTTGQCIHVLKSHGASVDALAISSNGDKCVSGSSDHSLLVWDLLNGQRCQVLNGHLKEVTSVAITPDNNKCVSGSWDRTLRVWDLTTGVCLRVLEGHKSVVSSVLITPDGSKCISGSWDSTLRVWDLTTGDCCQVLEGHKGEIYSFAITPDGKECISGSKDHTLRVWDLINGQCIHVLEGHKDYIKKVAVTPDGERCISGSDDFTLRVWDLKTSQCLHVLEGHQGSVNTIAITPNGTRCISGSWDHTLRIWDLANGQCIHVLEGHREEIKVVAVTPDGERCVSGSNDYSLRIWNLTNGRCIHVLEGHYSSIKMVSITPDGKRSICGSDNGSLHVWDLTQRKCIRVFEGHKASINTIAVTPDGRKCVSGSSDHTLRVWDLKKGRCLHILEGNPGSINTVAISQDGLICVSGSDDGLLCVWDLKNGQRIHVLNGHSRSVNTVAITADGGKCISGSSDHTLRIWDLKKGDCIHVLEGHKHSIHSIVLTQDDKVCISGSGDNTPYLWNLSERNIRPTRLRLNHYESFCSARIVALTPDGKQCISGSDHHKLYIWNLQTGQFIDVLSGHNGPIRTIAITNDGRKCVSGSADHTLRVWDLEKGRCLHILEGNLGPINTVAITPDDRICVSGSDNGTLSITDLNTYETTHISILPLSVLGLALTKSIIPDNLRETLRQNGAIV